MDVNDIKIGHTYFLGKKEFAKEKDYNSLSNDEKDKLKKMNEDYLVYRIIYQIWPIYHEYIKDGLIDNNGKQAVNEFAKCLQDALTELDVNGKREWKFSKASGDAMNGFGKETLKIDILNM